MSAVAVKQKAPAEKARRESRPAASAGASRSVVHGLAGTMTVAPSLTSLYAGGAIGGFAAGVQAKLSIGAPGDPYERQADAVADQVTAGGTAPAISPIVPGALGGVARQAEDDESPVQPRLVQRQEDDEEAVQTFPLQRQAQDEEAVQTLPIQRQDADDEPVQPLVLQRQEDEVAVQPFPVQLQEDDEPVQTLPIQRQETDEEAVQALSIQRQEADEEPVQATIQRQEESEEPVQASVQRQDDEEAVQERSEEEVGGSTISDSSVEERLRSAAGGEPLPADAQADLEARFGHDFSGVRIHTDAAAAELNRSLRAQAFAHGEDVYFAPGKFDLQSPSGQHLLAHELTHVVQQGKAPATAANAPGLAPAAPMPAVSATPAAVQREEDDEDDRPSEEERAAALAAAEVAEGEASETFSEGQQNVRETEREKQAEDRAADLAQSEVARAEAATVEEVAEGSVVEDSLAQEGEAAPVEDEVSASDEAAAEESATAKPKAAQGGGHGAAGDGASDRAPASPEQDPAFRASIGKVRKVSGEQRSHDPASAKADEAQEAAESPESEITGKAQSNQVDAMEEAEAPAFDKAAFKAKLLERIKATAPKTMKDAEKFKQEDRLGAVKGELGSQVTDEKAATEKPLAEQAAAEPDTASVEPKPTTPLPPADAGPEPPDVGAAKAVPKAKGESELEAPLAAESASIDDQMAEADVDEEQLRNANEPEFQGAADAKQEAQTHAAEAPVEVRGFEQGRISQAEGEAMATARERTRGMYAERGQVLGQVEGQQGETKTQDEQARDQVAQHIQGLYETTKTNVETILEGLDEKVGTAFDEGAAAAKEVFEDYVDTKMTAYKERRYGGWFGWARWAKDKIKGMPSEVNAFYAEGRRLYLQEMDAVIDNVVSIVGTGITESKAEVAKGKKEIQDYVAGLPDDLQKVGQEAAEDIEGKFDQLEQQIESKQSELVDSLAQKYRENLEAIDSRIDELKAANAGLIDKAINAVVGVIKAILKLKDMLLKVLAKVAQVVGTIIKDPIGFLGNLISALTQGFENFATNIWTHLKTGLIGWLTGALGPAGITLPEDPFSLKGIFSLVTQVLGVSWDYVREKAVNLLGEPVVNALEGGWEVFQILAKDGPMGLWEVVKEQFNDLKEAVIEQIKSMVVTEVIKAGVKWIMGLLTPAGAFIKAAMAIYDIVMFFIERGRQIIELVNSVIDSIAAIASGSIGAAAKLVEDTLARALPLMIGFLASLLGLSGLSDKVMKIIKSLRKRIDRAIDKLLLKAKKAGQKLLRELGLGKGKDDKASGDDAAEAKPAQPEKEEPKVPTGELVIGETVHFDAEGEKHKLWIETHGSDAVVMMASDPKDIPTVFKEYSAWVRSELDADDEVRIIVMDLVREGRALHRRINAPADKIAAGAKKRKTPQKPDPAAKKQIKADQKRLAAVMKELEEVGGEQGSWGTRFRIFAQDPELGAHPREEPRFQNPKLKGGRTKYGVSSEKPWRRQDYIKVVERAGYEVSKSTATADIGEAKKAQRVSTVAGASSIYAAIEPPPSFSEEVTDLLSGKKPPNYTRTLSIYRAIRDRAKVKIDESFLDEANLDQGQLDKYRALLREAVITKARYKNLTVFNQEILQDADLFGGNERLRGDIFERWVQYQHPKTYGRTPAPHYVVNLPGQDERKRISDGFLKGKTVIVEMKAITAIKTPSTDQQEQMQDYYDAIQQESWITWNGTIKGVVPTKVRYVFNDQGVLNAWKPILRKILKNKFEAVVP